MLGLGTSALGSARILCSLVLAAQLSFHTAIAHRSQTRIALIKKDFRLSFDGTSDASSSIDQITDAQFAGDGTVLILDAKNFRVSRYSSQGKYIGSFGRQGSGPGEMQKPLMIRALANNTIALSDNALARLTFLGLTPSGLSLIRSVHLARIPQAQCVSKGSLIDFSYNRADQTILHRLGLDGETQRSFGTPFFGSDEGSPDDIAALNISGHQGTIECIDDSGMVVVGSALRGNVYGYSAVGRLVWHTRLTDYVPYLYKVIGKGTMMGFLPGKEKRDAIIGIHRLTPQFVAVQVGEMTREKPWAADRDFVRIETRILDLHTGVEVGRQDDLPAILATAKSRMLTAGIDSGLWLESWGFAVESVPAGRNP
jgi:hypothetical protein